MLVSMKKLYSCFVTAFYNFAAMILPIGSNPEWVQLDPIKKYVLGMDTLQQDLDPSVWVLFYKKIDNASFSVRFPTDPEYCYKPDGIILESKTASRKFTLQVIQQQGQNVESILQKSLQDINLQQLYIMPEGDSVWKIQSFEQDIVVFLSVLENSGHIFVFQTQVQKNDVFQREIHEKFVSSFSLF